MFSKFYKTPAFQSGIFYGGVTAAGVLYINGVVEGISLAEKYLLQADTNSQHEVECSGCNAKDFSNPFDGPPN